jgi:CheY-like chemotaxis protein
MNDQQPIVIIEDDMDDHEIFREAFVSLDLKHELIFYTEATKALDFLLITERQPFFILSDMNLPGMNGLAFRTVIQENEYLKQKSIPFIFFTTGTSKSQVREAYDLTVQGFFIKPASFAELQHRLKLIVDYWSVCIHPNSF